MLRPPSFLIPCLMALVVWTVMCHDCHHRREDSGKCNCTEQMTDRGKVWSMDVPVGYSDACKWTFPVQDTNILEVLQRGGFMPGWTYRNACLSLEPEDSDGIYIYNTSHMHSEAKWCFHSNLTIRYRGDMCFYPDPNNMLQIIVREIETNRSICEDGNLVRYECIDNEINITSLPSEEDECLSLQDMTREKTSSGVIKDKVLLVLIAAISSVVVIVFVTSAVAIYRHYHQGPEVNLYSHLNISQKYIPPPSDPNRPLPSLPATQDYVLHTLTGPDLMTGPDQLPSTAKPASTVTETPDVYQDADSATSDLEKGTNMNYSLLQEEDGEEERTYAQCPSDSLYSYEGPAANGAWATFGSSQKKTDNSFKENSPEYSVYRYEEPIAQPKEISKAPSKVSDGYEQAHPIFMVNPDYKQDNVYSCEQPVGSVKAPEPVAPDYEEVDDMSNQLPELHVSPVTSIAEDEKPSDAVRAMTRGMSQEPKPTAPVGLKGVWKFHHQQGEDLELKHRPYSYPCFTKF